MSVTEAGGASPYYFDVQAADRVCRFFEQVLRHTQGRHAGRPFVLQPWQRKLLRQLFGWKRKSDGARRYRRVFIEIPRKQGKSTLASGIALYLLAADGEPGALVYSAAADKEQAKIVFKQAQQFIEKSDVLVDELEVVKNEIRLRSDSGSTYTVLSADVKNKHGQNPHGIIFDELHVQPNRNLFDVLWTGLGARLQPMFVMITTAGDDVYSICYEQYEYARQVRDGVIQDDEYFVYIAEAPADADWTDPAVWRLANPSLGVTVPEEYLAAECRRAQASPAAQNRFRRLHLNQWVKQAVRWMDLAAWDACATPLPDLTGRACYLGLDMATTTDVAAWVALYPPVEEGEPWWIQPRFYVPAANLDERGERNRAPYATWVRQGHLIATEGNVIDYATIERDMLEFATSHTVLQVGADSWNAQQMAQNLQAAGLEFWAVRQRYSELSPATKQLEILVLSGQVGHGGHPVMRWMVDNVSVTRDAADNIKPDKAKSRNKIDGVIATVNALSRAMVAAPAQTESVYSSRGLLFLDIGGTL